MRARERASLILLEINLGLAHLYNADDKESACSADQGSIPGSGRFLEKEMAIHSSTLAGESHGQRSLAGYSQ